MEAKPEFKSHLHPLLPWDLSPVLSRDSVFLANGANVARCFSVLWARTEERLESLGTAVPTHPALTSGDCQTLERVGMQSRTPLNSKGS